MFINCDISIDEVRWEKEQPKGETMPRPRAQHVACVTPSKDRIFMFGGHANPTTRLNDCWWLDVKDYTWTRVEGDKDVPPNQESTIGAPPPRANAGYYMYNNKVYIYGGHGGLSYSRIAFSDIYSFDLETLKWQKYEPVQ